jgi:tetratricopeptide (TPR) repeat protein
MLKNITLILFSSILSQSVTATEAQSKIHLDQADKLWSKSKFEHAESEFKQALQENSQSPAANAHYAGFLLTQNKTKQAIDIYKRAITLDATNPKLFAALSIAYLHQSKYEMATAMANEALRLNPQLSSVKKINEYIDAKKEVIQKASHIPRNQLKPNNAIHNKSNIHSNILENIDIKSTEIPSTHN